MVEITNDDKSLDDDLFVNDDSGSLNERNDDNKNGSKKKEAKRRRNRGNKKKKAVDTSESGYAKDNSNSNKTNENKKDDEENDKDEDEIKIEIELVPEEVVLDKNFSEFTRIFERFKFGYAGSSNVDADEAKSKSGAQIATAATGKAAELERMKARIVEDEEEDEREKKEQAASKDAPKLSKKKLKQQTRLSVAALKQLALRPDVVDMYDVTAADPKMLVYLKSMRNSVQVPRHWCAKRKYLQGKRGFEKSAFDLPDFIKRTGIMAMREAVQEKDRNKSLKQKMREKVRPKTGRVDIDYQKLHDAFFRWQTKPRMTIHGDLYYEGKELETRLKEKKPGNLTDDLRIALGMPTGPNAEKVPPPWLIAMQRYGPPPSYPSLRIPGLNAPIPEGCSFGYHAGGWGKPPVDEFGRPLYGDVFGTSSSDMRKPLNEEPVDLSLWGEMEDEVYEVMPDEEEEHESEEEDDEAKKEAAEGEAAEEAEEGEGGGEVDETAGLKTPGEGLMTPSGISTGLHTETPDMIELRKRKHQIEADMEGGGDEDGEAPALYKVLPERAASIGASMMGSSKVYDLSAAKKVVVPESGIDMALNPEELDMASDLLQSKLDAQMKQAAAARSEIEDGDESLSAPKKKKKKAEEEAVKQKQQQQQQQQQSAEKSKKYKEFKF